MLSRFRLGYAIKLSHNYHKTKSGLLQTNRKNQPCMVVNAFVFVFYSRPAVTFGKRVIMRCISLFSQNQIYETNKSNCQI